jgi:hypothetical protein
VVVEVVSELCQNHDNLAEDCLEFTHDSKQVHMTNQPSSVSIGDNGEMVQDPDNITFGDVVVPCGVQDAPVEAGMMAAVEDKASRNYTCCQDILEVRSHRRIHLRKYNQYVCAVKAEIKNRLGVPKRNAANQLAVRRMAQQIMMKHGLRPSHMRPAIEMVIAAVFIPDEHDLLSAKILASNVVADMQHSMDNASPKSYWRNLWATFSRGEIREEEG